MNVLILGGVSYDDIIHVEAFLEPVSQTVFAKDAYSMVGSTGSGKAIALQKLGFDVTMIAAIGTDVFGDIIIDTMKQSGIKFYPEFFGSTERHTNIMDASGRRISIFTTKEDGSNIDVSKYETNIIEADIVILNIKDYCKKFIPLLQKHQKTVYCDIHDYDQGNPYHQEFLDAADYLFLSSDRLPEYKKFMEDMIEAGKKWIVVTHADKGASAMDSEKNIIDIDSDSIDIVDTNGAGDNFFAGFLYGDLNAYSLEESLLMGKFAANACIQSKEITGEMLSEEFLLKKLSETKKKQLKK
ncbi:MAG: carbohydrate kinase family protein [Bacilli bacterium]|nr:carbohydrate kinase family protein [Bacilli bacterium]MBN2877583.1 carbohydrate kinase family protein [Bacilli bacterium]